MAKKNLTIEEINNKLLFVTDNAGRSVLYWVAERGNFGTLNRLWECAKENLTIEELNNRLFGTENAGRSVWYWAEKRGNFEILNKLWE